VGDYVAMTGLAGEAIAAGWRSCWLRSDSLTRAQVGRAEDGPLLEDGVHLTEELGVKAYLASWTVNLAGGLLAAGQAERARQTAQRPPGNQAQRPDRVSKGVPASASARRHPPLYFGWGTILI